MEQSIFKAAFDHLFDWCRERHFSGYDPFDGLNSRLFQTTSLKRSAKARWVWTQLFKRSPVNFRPLALVPTARNAKGIALFALASLANFRRLRTKEAEEEARRLLADLLSMRLRNYSGAAWGYNFDWQSRLFFAPHDVPTIVPTAFAARALMEATTTFEEETYLGVLRSISDFILDDLPRSEGTNLEVCFGYSPAGKTRIYNASLLAAQTLAELATLTKTEDLKYWAVRAARYAVRRQRKDGSWTYGEETSQGWVDNFHTAYVLSSLHSIIEHCGGDSSGEIDGALRRGYRFWRERFFLADGRPKYYDDELYPIDTHAAATAIVTLLELKTLDRNAPDLAQVIALWSIRNLQHPSGFFYYQKRRFYTVRTPFMRWTQGWMLYALARLLETYGKS